MITRDEAKYRLLSVGTGVLGGAIAGAVATRIWRRLSGADEFPKPTALDRRSREVLAAGVVQGAVFGLVKTVLSRLTAKGYRRFTATDRASLNGAKPAVRSGRAAQLSPWRARSHP